MGITVHQSHWAAEFLASGYASSVIPYTTVNIINTSHSLSLYDVNVVKEGLRKQVIEAPADR
jgi:hypothetical protein